MKSYTKLKRVDLTDLMHSAKSLETIIEEESLPLRTAGFLIAGSFLFENQLMLIYQKPLK